MTTDLLARLRGLLDEHAPILPLRYENGPDYAEIAGAVGDLKVALTMYPDLLTEAVNALPGLLDLIESQAARIKELEGALQNVMALPGEINPSNYDHDDVIALNQSHIDAFWIASAMFGNPLPPAPEVEHG